MFSIDFFVDLKKINFKNSKIGSKSTVFCLHQDRLTSHWIQDWILYKMNISREKPLILIPQEDKSIANIAFIVLS